MESRFLASEVLSQLNARTSDIKRLAVGLALSTVAYTGCFSSSNNEHQPRTHQTSGEITSTPDSDVNKSEYLTRILNEAGNEEFPVNRLISKKYRELGFFEYEPVSKKTVRIIQVGGDFTNGEITGEQIKQIERTYKLYNDFASMNPQINVPMVEVDVNGSIVSRRSARASIKPKNKDIVLFLVPASVDIGHLDYSGVIIPNTFTNTGPETISSFVRPDFPGGKEGLMVEACQATVDSSLLNLEDYADISDEKRSRIGGMAQEVICNSIGKALYDLSSGFSFDEYKALRSNDSTGRSNDPVPGDNAFLTIMPYIGTNNIYGNLINGIPADLGKSFIYRAI